MREIKFRLIKDGKIVGYEKAVMIDGRLQWAYKPVGEERYSLHCYIPHDRKEQYIDRTDKNGKEVYEGDILALSRHREITGIIRWDGHQSQFYIDGEMFGDWIRSIYVDTFDNLEVIGNIHENPELLKGVIG